MCNTWLYCPYWHDREFYRGSVNLFIVNIKKSLQLLSTNEAGWEEIIQNTKSEKPPVLSSVVRFSLLHIK